MRWISLVALVFISASLGVTCEVARLVWTPLYPDADQMYPFEQSGKVGFIDQTGRVVIPPKFPRGDDEFHDGLLEIDVWNGVYADKTGKTMIKGPFFRGWSFSDGLAVAMEHDHGKWGYIDRTGKFAISPRFETYPKGYVESFHGGYAKITVAGNVGYIDHSGEFAIQPHFLDGDSFFEGTARVIVEGPCAYNREESGCPDFGIVPQGTKIDDPPKCKYTFVDPAGHLLGQRFGYARHFSEGVAAVRINDRWGYVDKTGTVVIKPRFDWAELFSDGLARVRDGGLFGYIDHSGDYVIQPRFKSAGDFADGLAAVSDSQTAFWYIKPNGLQAFEERFMFAGKFFKGLANVQINRGNQSAALAYIDTSGHRVFTYSNR